MSTPNRPNGQSNLEYKRDQKLEQVSVQPGTTVLIDEKTYLDLVRHKFQVRDEVTEGLQVEGSSDSSNSLSVSRSSSSSDRPVSDSARLASDSTRPVSVPRKKKKQEKKNLLCRFNIHCHDPFCTFSHPEGWKQYQDSYIQRAMQLHRLHQQQLQQQLHQQYLLQQPMQPMQPMQQELQQQRVLQLQLQQQELQQQQYQQLRVLQQEQAFLLQQLQQRELQQQELQQHQSHNSEIDALRVQVEEMGAAFTRLLDSKTAGDVPPPLEFEDSQD